MVYLNLLDEIWHHAEALCILESHTLHAITTSSDHRDDELPLLIGLKDLHFNESNGNYYMGSVRGGLGLGEEHVHTLDIMEEDEPIIDDNGPAIVLPAFSDDEIDGADGAEDW
ncbi:hypothetical protein V8B97DRAFT_2008476 [Scleroderma yunnanense]